MADESKAGESNLTVVTATPDTFDATLEKHLGHPRLFTLFTGAVSETTGKSWCVCNRSWFCVMLSSFFFDVCAGVWHGV